MASEEEKMQGILETVDQQEMVGICGRNDEFLRLIRGAFDCTIVARGNQISMSGCAEEVAQLEQLLQELLLLHRFLRYHTDIAGTVCNPDCGKHHRSYDS